MSTNVRTATAPYRGPILSSSLWQIANSFIPYLLICGAMYALVDISYLATLALGVLAAGFMVRIFILQHDCGHYSFFKARWANAALGTVCSLVTMTPFLHWRRQHAQHHQVWNNLDRRDTGVDIYSTCLTSREYLAMSPWQQFTYRLSRHPVLTLIVLPPFIFTLLYRISFDTPKEWRQERWSVYGTNLAIGALFLGLGFFVGIGEVLAVQIPIVALAAIGGVWLFSVQHRFEAGHWARQSEWTSLAASLQGSSFLKLPRVLQWITGNIGYHHVHHLNPLIPNYRLQACHDGIPAFQAVPVLRLGKALRSAGLVVWDEDAGQMITFAKVGKAAGTNAGQ